MERPGNSCTINSTGTETHMMLPTNNYSLYNSSGYSSYNAVNYTDAKYVGYMYWGAEGEASTSREQATTNETSTKIKRYLEAWYETNISGTDYENHISNTLFCNDRELNSGTGFGTSTTYYIAYYRLDRNKIPSLKCYNQNDRFTTTNYNNASVPGNNASGYPIGLLTADEGSFAGLRIDLNNTTNYLYTNQRFWTMTPYRITSSMARVWGVGSDGNLRDELVTDSVGGARGVRGVLNLTSNTLVTGSGTTLDPYIVED